MRLQKRIMVFVLFCVLVSAGANSVFAKTITIDSTQTYNRILFVVDVSNSMNYQDENKLVHEIIKMFGDAAHSTKTEIGIITYNDQILTVYPLTPIAEITQRSRLKTEVDNMVRQGSTDIGLALNYGMDMLMNGSEEGNRPVMVLISDGETDLTYTRTGRTMTDSRADEIAAFEKANSINCPIYPIGISRNGNLNTAYLYEIANSTGGKAYDVQSAQALSSVAQMIFFDITDTDINFSDMIDGTGGPQNIALDIPKQYAEETNVLLFSHFPLSNVWIEGDGGNSTIYSSVKYTGIKFVPPEEERITIHFTAQVNDEIQVGIINNFNIFPKVNMPVNPTRAEVAIEAILYDLNSGSVITEEIFYDGLSATLRVTDQDTGETSSQPMENTGQNFVTAYSNGNPRNSALQVIVEGGNYSAISNNSAAQFTNSAPDSLGGASESILKNKQEVYELNDYFIDADGDPLQYEIAGPFNYSSIATIEGSSLIVSSDTLGDTTISVRALDGRGGTVLGSFEFSIIPFWIYYRNPIIIIGCIIIVLLLAYLYVKSKRPVEIVAGGYKPVAAYGPQQKFNSARFEGYFLDTQSGNEIPVLNWNASYIENKHKVSLGELLAMMDVLEKLPEAHKIFFEAGNNSTVIFYHNTKCIINIGDKTIPDSKKVVLKYDAKLYIIFEDNVTELEVRYKRARKLVTA